MGWAKVGLACMEKDIQIMIITIALLTQCHNGTVNLILPTLVFTPKRGPQPGMHIRITCGVTAVP